MHSPLLLAKPRRARELTLLLEQTRSESAQVRGGMTPGTNQPAERGEKARQSEQCAWLTSVKTPHGMHYTLLRVAMLATCNGNVTSIPTHSSSLSP